MFYDSGIFVSSIQIPGVVNPTIYDFFHAKDVLSAAHCVVVEVKRSKGSCYKILDPASLTVRINDYDKVYIDGSLFVTM